METSLVIVVVVMLSMSCLSLGVFIRGSLQQPLIQLQKAMSYKGDQEQSCRGLKLRNTVEACASAWGASLWKSDVLRVHCNFLSNTAAQIWSWLCYQFTNSLIKTSGGWHDRTVCSALGHWSIFFFLPYISYIKKRVSRKISESQENDDSLQTLGKTSLLLLLSLQC